MTEPSVADLMREWRRAAGLSTAEAGARIGLSARTIEGIEQGRRDGDDLARLGLLWLIERSQKRDQQGID